MTHISRDQVCTENLQPHHSCCEKYCHWVIYGEQFNYLQINTCILVIEYSELLLFQSPMGLPKIAFVATIYTNTKTGKKLGSLLHMWEKYWSVGSEEGSSKQTRIPPFLHKPMCIEQTVAR